MEAVSSPYFAADCCERQDCVWTVYTQRVFAFFPFSWLFGEYNFYFWLLGVGLDCGRLAGQTGWACRRRLLCHTAGMSAVSHSRHVCSVTQQTYVLCDTVGMSAVSHSGQVCCVKKQTCLLCDTADMSAVSHSRHVCCVTQQTCLLCYTADMSDMSHSGRACCRTQLRPPNLFGLPRTAKMLKDV